jgi:hypothetical protein
MQLFLAVSHAVTQPDVHCPNSAAAAVKHGSACLLFL